MSAPSTYPPTPTTLDVPAKWAAAVDAQARFDEWEGPPGSQNAALRDARIATKKDAQARFRRVGEPAGLAERRAAQSANKKTTTVQ